jgi:hypothetical protein
MDDEHGEYEVPLEPIEALTREARLLARGMPREEARGLVDLYYRWQDERIKLRGQARAALQGADPGTSTLLVTHFAQQAEALERQTVGILKEWAGSIRVGEWAMNQLGIGPVLAAGLLAHIDITRARTAGAIYRYAGLDPNSKWYSRDEANAMVKDLLQVTFVTVSDLANSIERNPEAIWRFATTDARGNERRPTKATVAAAIARRPHNAKLKKTCWLIGDSFVKVSNNPKSLYGRLYRERKQYEVERNESGGNAEAVEISLRRNIQDADLRKTLLSGKLPAGQIDLRARRFAVKIFLSHYFEVAYRDHYHEDPPAPFAIAQLGHAHYIPVPEG